MPSAHARRMPRLGRQKLSLNMSERYECNTHIDIEIYIDRFIKR